MGLVLVLGGLLIAAGFLAVGALGRQAQSPTIVLDQSIGGIALGMTRAQVEALYGAPDSTLAITLRGGGTGVLARYDDVKGGVLLVTYAGDRVVNIETTSPFFRTEAGIGPGSSKGGAHGLRADFCTGGLWTGVDGMPPDAHVTVFTLSGDLIFSVTITELGYLDVCRHTGANQEGADPRGSAATLSVVVEPDGAGWVRSSPYAIDCPTKCTAGLAFDATVTLAVNATIGFTFEGWGGACSGKGSCVVTLDESKSVTATFSGAFAPPPVPGKPPTGGSQ